MLHVRAEGLPALEEPHVACWMFRLSSKRKELQKEFM